MTTQAFPAPTKGLCSSTEVNRELFASAYTEPFDEESFREEHPDANDSQVTLAKNEHSGLYFSITAAAKEVCNQCPFLDQCTTWVMDDSHGAVAGVVAGMTETERAKIYRSDMKKNLPVSAPYILTATDQVDMDEMLKSLF